MVPVKTSRESASSLLRDSRPPHSGVKYSRSTPSLTTRTLSLGIRPMHRARASCSVETVTHEKRSTIICSCSRNLCDSERYSHERGKRERRLYSPHFAESTSTKSTSDELTR